MITRRNDRALLLFNALVSAALSLVFVYLRHLGARER